MKKIISLLIALICLTSVFTVFAETPIKVSVNDAVVSMEFAPVIENDRTLVPVRPFINALGGSVIMWDADTATAHLQSADGDILSLQVGTKKLFKSSETIDLDVAAKIIDGNTMVPLRAICESLGYTVEWIAETREVKVTK